MKDEYNSLQERETWELVPIENFPAKYNVLSGKWIFKLKSDRRKKSRRVVHGFQQKYGIDYHEALAIMKHSPLLREILLTDWFLLWQPYLDSVFSI